MTTITIKTTEQATALRASLCGVASKLQRICDVAGAEYNHLAENVTIVDQALSFLGIYDTQAASDHEQARRHYAECWAQYFAVDDILDEIKAYESLGLSYEDAPLTIEVECLALLLEDPS